MHLTLRTRIARQHLLALALPASFALTFAPAAHAADGTWTLDSNTGATWNASNTAPWSGGIVAEGADFTADFSNINITGDRTVTLSAALTIGNLKFGDLTTASHGWLLSGSTLTLQTTTGTPTITVNALGSGKAATISSALVGSQGFAKAGVGRLVLSGGHSSLTGVITVDAGTLDLWDATTAYSNSISLTATTSTVDAANSFNGTVTIDGSITGLGRIIKTNGGSTLVLNGNNTYSGGTTLTDGTIAMGAGLNNGIGTGTLTLTGGTLRSSDNNSRTIINPFTMGSNNLRFGGAQGDITGLGNLTFTSTTGTSIGGNKTWTVNNATVVTFANNWNGNAGWNVTKAGTGTLVFNGNLNSNPGVIVNAGQFILNGANNAYAGTTTVNGGTLFVNGAKTGSGTVTVNSTGTLGGSGSIAGATSAAAGSFLAPGASAGSIGTLTFTGALDVSGLASSGAGGGLIFNLDGVGSSDKIVAGTVSIGSGALDLADFSFSTLGGFGTGVYTLIDATSIVGSLGSSLTGTLGGFDTVLSIDGANNLILTVTAAAVPEPSSFAVLAGALALASVGCSRRRRAA